MPIRSAIWTVGPSPQRLADAALPSEAQLEEMIVAGPAILSDDWMLIGRQEPTGSGGRIDLLAIAPDASLVLVELKRDMTPREVVAQALDYADWVEGLTGDQIAAIYKRFKGGELGAAFQARFNAPLDEEALNVSHQVVVVAASLDPASERIVGYLSRRGVPVNVLTFQVVRHGDALLLSRAWLLDPAETQASVAASPSASGPKEPWNGEFYANFGHGESRDWEEARAHGFISAGGGT